MYTLGCVDFGSIEQKRKFIFPSPIFVAFPQFVDCRPFHHVLDLTKIYGLSFEIILSNANTYYSSYLKKISLKF